MSQVPLQADKTSPIVLTQMVDTSRGQLKQDDVFGKTDFDKSKNYFHILPHEEPHAVRRRAMMEKYGDKIRPLFGHDIRSFYVAVTLIITQLVLSYYVAKLPIGWFLIVMWVVGATLNHTCQCLVHDITHYLALPSTLGNRILACAICIPTALPSAITFGKYHWEHHQNMGDPKLDADLPTDYEIAFFCTPIRKFFFVLCQPIFYVLRPLLTRPKVPSGWELICWATIITSNYLVYNICGGWGLAYLLLSTFFSMGMHPAGAHTIAEHYEFVKGQESFNYYGFWNFFNINLGYHIEHHDFPSIACWNLPKLQEIAPEFYKDIPHHKSYVKVIYNFIMDKNIGSFSRIDTTEDRIKKQQQKSQ